MTAQMVTTNGRDLAPAAWESKLDLIKRTVANGCTDDELQLFLYHAKKTGLDPLARQIYCIRRRSGDEYKATIQTGIDGYRLIADRTGLCAGNDDPIFEGDDDGHPLMATVTVWKLVGGQRCGFTATARWSEYKAQGPMWQRMPYLMLGKVAEALALRKAFPADLSGIFTDTEMAQADYETATFQPAPAPRGPGVPTRSAGPVNRDLGRPAAARPAQLAAPVIHEPSAAGPEDDAPHPADTIEAEGLSPIDVKPDLKAMSGAPATEKQLQTISRMARAAGQTINTEGMTRANASATISSLVNEMGGVPR